MNGNQNNLPDQQLKNCCPGKEAALGIIVVSLTCTTYQCGSLIVLCDCVFGNKEKEITNNYGTQAVSKMI